MNSVRTNNLSLEYQKKAPSDCRDIGILFDLHQISTLLHVSIVEIDLNFLFVNKKTVSLIIILINYKKSQKTVD